jgi:hypothetical protein
MGQAIGNFTRQGQPDMTLLYQQVQERVKTEVFDILKSVLRQQEDNVVQAILPKITPALIMVEEIYGFMKKVEGYQVPMRSNGAVPPGNVVPVPTQDYAPHPHPHSSMPPPPPPAQAHALR